MPFMKRKREDPGDSSPTTKKHKSSSPGVAGNDDTSGATTNGFPHSDAQHGLSKNGNFNPTHDQLRSLADLEATLVNLTATPDLVEKLLGPDAGKPVRRLLKLLQARREVDGELPPTETADAKNHPLAVPEPSTVGPFTHLLLDSSGLPPLPELPPGPGSLAPFTHRSHNPTDKVTGQTTHASGIPISASTAASRRPGTTTDPRANDGNLLDAETNYERLEFLGDAYLELFATQLIFTRYPGLPTGRASRLRESMINNERLCGFARQYGFDARLRANMGSVTSGSGYGGGGGGGGWDGTGAATMVMMKGNKGLNKVLADVFEAYVAAVVLAGPGSKGVVRARDWLEALWAPVLAEKMSSAPPPPPPPPSSSSSEWGLRGGDDRGGGGGGGGGRRSGNHNNNDEGRDGTWTGNGNRHAGKTTATATTKMTREEERDAALALMRRNQAATDPYQAGAKAELQRRIAPAHVKLVYREARKPLAIKGGCIFYQEVLLTGWGHERLLLGRGEGESKAEAGNRAATEALRFRRDVVEECEAKWREDKERRKRAEAEAVEVEADAGKGAGDAA